MDKQLLRTTELLPAGHVIILGARVVQDPRHGYDEVEKRGKLEGIRFAHAVVCEERSKLRAEVCFVDAWKKRVDIREIDIQALANLIQIVLFGLLHELVNIALQGGCKIDGLAF
jgi:hypothetical protein